MASRSIGFLKMLACFTLAFAVSFTLAKDNSISLKSISEGLNVFSSNLFKQIGEQTAKDNLVVSPLSAHVILSMTAYGAGGNTAHQMKDSLHLPKDDALGKKEFKYLANYMNGIENVTLEIANSIYLSNQFKMKPTFKHLSKSYFLAEASELDFNDVSESVSTINRWTKEKTHNKIPEIISDQNINADTKMILLNAVYFKGNWAEPFNKNITSKRPFYLTKDDKKDVSTMYKQSKLIWGELADEKAKFVKLPYENKHLKMIVIVPDEVDGIDKIWQNIERFDSKKLEVNIQKRMVHLYLPKFKVRSEITLNDPLSQLGMTDMFNYATANFTGISNERVTIAQVLQKAVIEVNEAGSEAAAATVIAGDRNLEMNQVTVDVNRPFYYRIVDDAKNLILFEGIVRDPVY